MDSSQVEEVGQMLAEQIEKEKLIPGSEYDPTPEDIAFNIFLLGMFLFCGVAVLFF